MRILVTPPHPEEIVVMSRTEALKLAESIIRQLADAPGCGGAEFILRDERDPSLSRRVIFMVGKEP
jgi:hypothetical protein